MDRFFPSWLNPKAFAVAFILTAIPTLKSLYFEYGITTESVVYTLVATLSGGFFWGVIFTLIYRIFRRQRK